MTQPGENFCFSCFHLMLFLAPTSQPASHLHKQLIMQMNQQPKRMNHHHQHHILTRRHRRHSYSHTSQGHFLIAEIHSTTSVVFDLIFIWFFFISLFSNCSGNLCCFFFRNILENVFIFIFFVLPIFHVYLLCLDYDNNSR